MLWKDQRSQNEGINREVGVKFHIRSFLGIFACSLARAIWNGRILLSGMDRSCIARCPTRMRHQTRCDFIGLLQMKEEREWCDSNNINTGSSLLA